MAVAREVIEARRRRRDEQAGRHRSVPAEGMAARVASRARGESELPRRRASRRMPTRRSRSWCATMRGKTLPLIGRIEISIIEESQPELLAFAQGELDFVALGGDDTEARAARTASCGRTSRSAASCTSRFGSPTRHVHVLQHGRSGRRRLLDASRSRCAARSAWASTSTR